MPAAVLLGTTQCEAGYRTRESGNPDQAREQGTASEPHPNRAFVTVALMFQGRERLAAIKWSSLRRAGSTIFSH